MRNGSFHKKLFFLFEGVYYNMDDYLLGAERWVYDQNLFPNCFIVFYKTQMHRMYWIQADFFFAFECCVMHDVVLWYFAKVPAYGWANPVRLNIRVTIFKTSKATHMLLDSCWSSIAFKPETHNALDKAVGM